MAAARAGEGADTLSARAAALLERDILAGALAPGARLGIAELARRYDIGATPLREGLSRLAARGLAVSVGQRGFRVSDVSRADLADITRLRVVVEAEALRLSMARGDGAWEAGIVAALHQLRRHVARAGGRFREGAGEFDALHKAFHTALLAACGSPRLLHAHGELYDEAYRYRRLMLRKFEGGKAFVEAHARLAALVLARDAAAVAMLGAHLESTLRYVYPPGSSGGGAS